MKPKRGAPLVERMEYYTTKTSSCWEWHGAKYANGYGQLRVNGKTVLAHRLAWQIANDRELTSEEHVCHKCDNPGCVNPSHLVVGSHSDNMSDRNRKARQARGERVAASKISADDVREIRRATGSLREIGNRFSITKQAVRAIRNGMVWTHVT